MRRGAASWVSHYWTGRAGIPGLAADLLLWPAEHLYRGASWARNRAYDHGLLPVEQPEIATVSIGNIAVGGAGKTPFSAWAAERLRDWGRRPAVVVSGYALDEVLLHRQLHPGIPTLVARDRPAGVAAAAAAGCDVAVLDDAFQHRRLARKLDLVLVPAERWSDHPRLLPRGPWREPPAALERSHAVVVTRKSVGLAAAVELASRISDLVDDRPVAVAYFEPAELEKLSGDMVSITPLEWLHCRSVLALTAIADPAAFVNQLRALNAEAELYAFPDHHHFTRSDVAGAIAHAAGRALVVTQKDAVKLRPLLPPATAIYAVRQRVVIESAGAALDRVLRQAVDLE